MYKMTWSFQNWLLLHHRELYWALMFGHKELFTKELKEEYLKWCATDEGQQYLQGGSKYKEI